MADTTDIIGEALEQAITTPESYEVDGEKITSRSVDDIIKADQYVRRRKKSTRNAFKSLGVNRISTAGTNE